MAGALRAKRGEWGLSRKARDEDHLTLCRRLALRAKYPPPGLAHKAPVKAGAFYEGINWVIVTFDFFPQRLTGYVKNKTVKKPFTMRLL